MNVVAIVQSRMGSSRLPGKALKPLAGRPMLQHVLERALHIRGVNHVVLATSLNERDTPLVDLAADVVGIPVYRGNEHDVLGRFAFVAEEMRADYVIRLTGDCPFLAPDVCEAVLTVATTETRWEYISNDTTCSGYPDGFDCEVFPLFSLQRAHAFATSHLDREHVTPWMMRHLLRRTVTAPEPLEREKLSVDCEQDLIRARRIFGYLENGDFSSRGTLAALAMMKKEEEA